MSTPPVPSAEPSAVPEKPAQQPVDQLPAALPLLLLPGLGTDERLFAVQSTAFPQLEVPSWLPPGPRDTLADYAARMADAIGRDRPCVVGGVSFGGMVALEMTRHLPARACVLISTIRTARELPWWARLLGRGAWLLPPSTDRWLNWFGGGLLRTCRPVLPGRIRTSCQHLAKLKSPYLPWAIQAIVRWRPSQDWPCPIYHLHGERDTILPARRTTPTHLVPEGGHVLPLSHPFRVNAFLEQVVAATASVPIATEAHAVVAPTTAGPSSPGATNRPSLPVSMSLAERR